jgi:hypothetical protein
MILLTIPFFGKAKVLMSSVDASAVQKGCSGEFWPIGTVSPKNYSQSHRNYGISSLQHVQAQCGGRIDASVHDQKG